MNECAECGFDWRLDPEAAIEIIAGGRHRITWVAALGGHGLGVRPEPARWSVLEYAAHLAEALRWYCDRITRVLTEERPQLESFDFDRACRDGGYGTRPIDSVLAEVEEAARRLTAVTEAITAEGWARTGIGSEGTDRTASILAARAAHEVVHHGIDMARTVLQTADPARAPLDLQMLVLLIAVRQNPVAVDVMQAAAACHLPDWYLGAGAVARRCGPCSTASRRRPASRTTTSSTTTPRTCRSAASEPWKPGSRTSPNG